MCIHFHKKVLKYILLVEVSTLSLRLCYAMLCYAMLYYELLSNVNIIIYFNLTKFVNL